MAAFRFYLFLAALCSCSTLGFGDITSPLPVTIDVAPVSSTPVADAPKPTEPDTTTSSTTSTTSTTTTTTTTEAPTTTTSTTTTTTTTTTTPAPPAPTPAPKPKPVPAPDQGTWMFTANNVTCIVAQFAAQITIKYSQSLQNKTSIANMTMNVPANASVLAGSCNETDGLQWMQLGWLAAETNAPNTIVMVFVKNDTTKTYKLHTFNLTIDASQLVNSSVKTDAIVLSHGEEWATPLATSYRCMTATHLKMSNDTFNVSANVAVSSLQEEAFRTAPGKGFSAARDCGGGDVPDAVPIAVGCALGGLVLVVLAAYLVARRRSAARGYLSM